ncbi:hypothetical protein [Nocardiopsis oceani]
MEAEAEVGEWFLRFFAPEELNRLERIPVRVPTGHEFELLGLLGAWYLHVRKLAADLPLPDTDPTAWGIQDVIAALFLRDFVERGLDELGTERTAGVDAAVADVDERFRALTEEDGDGRLALADPDAAGHADWWWRRIPVSGPARRELDTIVAQESTGPAHKAGTPPKSERG